MTYEKKDAVVNILKDLINNSKKLQTTNNGIEKTFFEIINKPYDEDLISKMVLYLLCNDVNLIYNLLATYSKKKKLNWAIGNHINVLEATAEKTMLWGRADLYIIAQDENNKLIVLTIENKINSWEHDEQTNTYFNWVNQQKGLNDAYKAFFYLKPDYNHSCPICSDFLPITYKEIKNMIKKDNMISDDFRAHIKKYLSEREMSFMEDEILFLSNYKEIEEIIRRSSEKREILKKNLISSIIEKLEIRHNPYAKKATILPKNSIVIEITDDDSTFRFYKKDLWYKYNSNIKFYFYVELKFENNDLKNICCQKTIKLYGKNKRNNRVRQFIEDKKIGYINIEGAFIIIEKKQFQSEKDFLSSEWQNDLKDFSFTTLKTYIIEMDDIFNEFTEYKMLS